MTTTGTGELRQRLAAILAADVVGYSRLMQSDQRATVAELDVVRSILRHQVEAHGGRITDTAGDAVLAIFDTVAGALYASVLAQAEISAHAEALPADRRMMLRVGVHMGDILEKDDGSVYGDGINIAARLESLAPAGGVTVSKEVHNAIGGESGLEFHDQGEFEAKNIARPVHVFLVAREGGPAMSAVSSAKVRRITKGNLPAQASTIIGRAGALEEVIPLLDKVRLVTLLGMGGMGKTTLSVEVARRISPEFPDGAWFADLAAVADPAAVGLAVAGVFGVTQQSGKTIEQSVVDALSARRLLLVLDNCEHVTAAAATLAHAILTACPHVKLIATSREEISVAGEHIWQVPPLEIAGETAPAIELFVERARAVQPGFEVGDHKEAIREICRELDGIPLAIELAAARVRSMNPRQILDRLGQRFRLLTGGSRAAPRERHQTLRQAVQWSFDLLSESERAVLTRATVFAGGFTLDAAESVCAGGEVDAFDVLDLLDSLVRKSLLYVAHSGDSPRYGMLETIRAFGAELLAEQQHEQAARHAHASFYAVQADENFQIWRSPREREAYEWLDLEINNLRNAFRWALDNDDVDIAARIASSVGDLARFRLREEAANWAEEIVDKARAARHPRLIVLLTWSASSAWAFSRFDDAKRFGEEALSLLGDDSFEPFVWAHGDLAFVSLFASDIDRAIELLRIGSEHPADRVDRFMLAFYLYIMATTGRAEEALEIADDVVAKVDAAGVPMAVSVAYGAKGAALEATDPAAALACYEHGIDVANRAGARFMETLIAPRIAALHARSGEPVVALHGFERMLMAFGAATDIATVSAWRTSLCVLFARLEHYQAAATLHGTLAGSIDPSGLVPEHADAVKRVQRALGGKTFSVAAARGAAMSLREASNYALLQIQLALSSLRQPAEIGG